MIFTGDPSPLPPPIFSFFIYSSRNVPTPSPRTERCVPRPGKKKITSKPAEFLKIKFPMLCCGPWCPPLPSQPPHDPMLQILPSGCSTPQCSPSWAAQTKPGRPERQETQPGGGIRWLGPFSVRLEFIKKMNTSLGEKLIFPLAETSGQDEVFLNEPADQLFYFPCRFPYCAIDFVWALQIFLYAEFLRLFLAFPR